MGEDIYLFLKDY